MLIPLLTRHRPKSLVGIEPFRLADHGISFDLSARAQQIAKYPKHILERFIEHATTHGKEITTRHLIDYANERSAPTSSHPTAPGKGEPTSSIRVAYADPPFFGSAHYYREHPDARNWNDPRTHRETGRWMR